MSRQTPRECPSSTVLRCKANEPVSVVTSLGSLSTRPTDPTPLHPGQRRCAYSINLGSFSSDRCFRLVRTNPGSKRRIEIANNTSNSSRASLSLLQCFVPCENVVSSHTSLAPPRAAPAMGWLTEICIRTCLRNSCINPCELVRPAGEKTSRWQTPSQRQRIRFSGLLDLSRDLGKRPDHSVPSQDRAY